MTGLSVQLNHPFDTFSDLKKEIETKKKKQNGLFLKRDLMKKVQSVFLTGDTF